jgi:hypothetical protein
MKPIKTGRQVAGRLGDLSWFMRVLNDGIARDANRKDQCAGYLFHQNTPLQQASNVAKRITLRYGQSIYGFHFASLNYTSVSIA